MPNLFSKGKTIVGALSVGGDLSLGVNKFTVSSANGNTVIAGTLSVTGAATFGPYIKLTPGSAPASPAQGMIYYDNSAKKLKVYTGSAWETVSST